MGASSVTKMPLKGLAIGDGLVDPPNQIDYGDFLYQVGLLDDSDRDLVIERTELAKVAMDNEQWHQATDVNKSFLTWNCYVRLPQTMQS
jgi:vitellogenic carboxypeptidase-like protein